VSWSPGPAKIESNSQGIRHLTLHRRFMLVFLLALTFAAYGETLRFQFVHDDREQIVRNPAVHSWRSLPQYFTAHVWAGPYPEEAGNYYRPLFLLWLRINWMVFGQHAWAWHLTTVLTHLLVTLLVYFLAVRVLNDCLTASMAALIFGLHPAHIEAVAWISGVTEPLLAVLLISSFLCYLKKYDDRKKARTWMGSSLILYGLAMLAKETALILPVMIFAYELICTGWTENRKSKIENSPLPAAPQVAAESQPASDSGTLDNRKSTISCEENAPMLAKCQKEERRTWEGRLEAGRQAVGSASPDTLLLAPDTRRLSPRTYNLSPVTCNLQAIRRAMASALPFLALVPPYAFARIFALKRFSYALTPLSASSVVYTWPSLLWFWIKHLVWPVGLSTFYDVPSVTHPNFSNFTLPAIGVLLAALGLSCWAVRSREITFACIWLVVPLIPLLNIRVFSRNDFAHDRYLYLPSVGFAMIVAVALRRLRFGRIGRLEGSAAPVAATLVLAVLMVFGTAYQSFYFQNNLIFYAHNLRSAPNNEFVRIDVAGMLGELGQYGEAVKYLETVFKDDPGSWLVNYNLGYTYYKLGRLDDAEMYLRRAIQINPKEPDDYLYLGLTRLKMGRLEDAAGGIRQAIKIRPDGSGYHFALGVVLKQQGHIQAALEAFQAELALDPEASAAREQIAQIQAELERRAP
jgi:Flp pilus assembly protein TadD